MTIRFIAALGVAAALAGPAFAQPTQNPQAPTPQGVTNPIAPEQTTAAPTQNTTDQNAIDPDAPATSPNSTTSQDTMSSDMSSQTASNGLSNQQVRDVQQALNDKGSANTQVDGVWGPKTEQALQSFQKDQNLQATGRLNDKTVAALGLNSSEFKKTGGGLN